MATNPLLLTARVTRDDKETIEKYAAKFGVDPAIVAGLAAEAGAWLIRGESVAQHMDRPGSSESRSAYYLWMILNREAQDYTEEIQLRQSVEDWQHEYDSEAVGRSHDDWLGTLIHVGLRSFSKPQALVSMGLSSGSDSVLEAICKAEAYNALQEVSPAQPGMVPVYLPAEDVEVLRSVSEAAGIPEGPDAVIRMVIGNIAEETRTTRPELPGGAVDLILSGWTFDSEQAATSRMLQALGMEKPAKSAKRRGGKAGVA